MAIGALRPVEKGTKNYIRNIPGHIGITERQKLSSLGVLTYSGGQYHQVIQEPYDCPKLGFIRGKSTTPKKINKKTRTIEKLRNASLIIHF